MRRLQNHSLIYWVIQRRNVEKGKFDRKFQSANPSSYGVKTSKKAFDTLKEALTTTPILAYPDYNRPFMLHTEASTDGLGAVLYQDIDRVERVIAYASRSLKPSEKNYPAHKLEFLALKWSVCHKFHEYLYGNKFQVLTDNNPLTYVLTSAKLDATGTSLAC